MRDAQFCSFSLSLKDKIGMHQTFYIDIDEEITSIIDRIRHARAKEIIMVVPKRALLIQSIVNLRILKKEADEADLQLMMVTQDKLGKILIEKAGIFVQQKIDNMVDEEISLQEDKDSKEGYKMENKEGKIGKNSGRLESIGSKSYFNDENDDKDDEINLEKIKKGKIISQNDEKEREKILNRELVTGIGSDIRKKQPEESPGLKVAPEKAGAFKMEIPTMADFKKDEGLLGQDKKIESFFYQSNNSENRPKKIRRDSSKDYNLSGKIRRWFWIFGAVSAVVFFGILAYLFVPRVDLAITVKTNTKSIDSEVTGDINFDSLDYDKGIIPARVVEIQQEITKSINATGSKSISNQKARGLVTIYNEYNSNPQPLVATTRLLTQDGKLFRLIKGVTVPGMTKNGEESKRGLVEAEVVADQSGEDYNIGPARFTIPGFQNSGNNKYSKFYAESAAAMTGGGDGAGQSNFITAEDISSARSDVLVGLEDAIKQKIKEAAGEEALLLDEAVGEDEAVYKLSNSEGDVADSFQITAGTKASAIVVNRKDLNDFVAHMIAKAGEGELNIDGSSITLDFGKPNVDFNVGTIDIKFHAIGRISPEIDLLTIKNEILGKNEEDLGEYLSTFKDIEKVEVDYWPSFINSRIPFRGKQVNVTLDK